MRFNFLFIISLVTALATTFSLPTYAKNPDSAAVILMYHHFGDDTPSSTSVTLAQFDAHLKYLEQNQYNVWPVSKLVSHWQQGKPVPNKTVVLTADDAYKSVYHEAYPRLKKRGWSMTTFVNSEPIDKRYGNFMTWEQMREMQADGFEFANHSLSHSRMRPLDNENHHDFVQRVRHELEQAQQRLQQELGENTNTDPKIFAYPYGEYSEAAAQIISDMGYVALAQVSGAVDRNSDRRALNRFPMAVNYAKMDDFILKINTKPLPLTSYEPFDPIVQTNPPQMTLNFERKISRLNCFNSRGELLDMNWTSDTQLVISSKNKLKPPRDRYACTAPSKVKGQWYWWGHLWVIKD